MRRAIASLLLLTLIIQPINSQNCPAGDYFDGGRCSPCDQRCTVCLSAFTCTSCQDQAYLTIQNGGLSCGWCSQLIPGCSICLSESSCKTCSQDYYLNDNKCTQISGGQVTISSSQMCQSYQVNINGVCFSAIAFCGGYDFDGTCNSCQNSQLIGGYCIPYNLASNFYSPSNKGDGSLICGQRQYINNGECLTIGQECLSFLSNGKCIECDKGFTTFNGLCVQQPASSSSILISYIPKITDQSVLASIENSNSQYGFSEAINQVQVPSNTLQSQPCSTPCATCSSNPLYCLTCLDGYTTVDELPGQCFRL